MGTYQASENLKLANKISKLVKGGVDPAQEPYELDDENILSILTLIYEYLVGEQVMFASVYEGSKAIEDWIKENVPGLAKEETLVAGIAIILDALNNIDLSEVAKEDTLNQGISDIRDDIANIDIDTSDLAKEVTLQGVGADADNIAHFFGVTLLEGYEFMQDTEVCDELEDIMQVIDPNLTAEQAAAITEQTLNPSES